MCLVTIAHKKIRFTCKYGELHASRCKSDRVYSGAMKANFGHTEGASGIAQLIKTVMILEKGIIPPIAELKNLNPKLKPEIWNFEVGSCKGIKLGGSSLHAL